MGSVILLNVLASINEKEPKEVVFISCVGSREGRGELRITNYELRTTNSCSERAGNEYCSRVCCMYIAKQAHLVKEHIPDANVTVFYTDVRAFGKGFEEFYWRVKEEGTKYIRRELTEEIKMEKDENGKLKVKTVSEGRTIRRQILSCLQLVLFHERMSLTLRGS